MQWRFRSEMGRQYCSHSQSDCCAHEQRAKGQGADLVDADRKLVDQFESWTVRRVLPEDTICLLPCLPQQSDWGLPLKKPASAFEGKSHHHKFSKQMTASTMQALKGIFDGSPYRITQPGHAAITMAALGSSMVPKTNSKSTNLFAPLFTNGRRYLDAENLNGLHHSPYVRSISIIEFHDAGRNHLFENADQREILEKMLIACQELKRSNERLFDQKSLLTEGFAAVQNVQNAWMVGNEKSRLRPATSSNHFQETSQAAYRLS